MNRYIHLPTYRYYPKEGYPVILDKSVGKDLKDYKIYGNSVQDGTPTPDNPVEIQSVGEKTKNILIYPYKNGTAKYNGVSFTDNGDGSITINGTSTASTNYYLFQDTKNLMPGLNVGNKISISKNPDDLTQQDSVYFVCNYYNSSATMIAGPLASYDLSATGTVKTEAVGSGIYLNVPKGKTINNLTVRPMIEINTKATEYEPYGYKIPVTVSGKNLLKLPVSSSTNKDITCYISDNNAASFEGISQNYPIFNYDVLNISANTSVTFTYNKNIDISVTFRLRNSVTNEYVAINNGQTVTPTFDVDRFQIALGPNIDYTNLKINNIQIEEGNTATEYEPYVEPKTYNIYLYEPLRKIGDYTDYIDFENQKVVRNVKVVDDTGTLTIKESYQGLSTPTEEIIELPTIPTHKGTNIIEVDTAIAPSNMEVQYYK